MNKMGELYDLVLELDETVRVLVESANAPKSIVATHELFLLCQIAVETKRMTLGRVARLLGVDTTTAGKIFGSVGP